MMTIPQKVTVTLLACLGVVAIACTLVAFAYFMIPKGHAYGHSVDIQYPTKPFVTDEPVDQKANMGMYDDAKGPPWNGITHVGMTRLPFGTCAKPGVVISVDEHGNGIYAEDNEVIWRCLQSGADGKPTGAPLVYCHQQRKQPYLPRIAWRCYHDYSVVFAFYEHDYGRSPLMLPDEVEYVETEVQ